MEPELPPGTKVTTGTQSDYRESEAQTTPYTPDFFVPEPSAKQRALNQQHGLIEGAPEVLALRDLTFGQGLPAGLAEAKQVESMREKRAFEAYLASLGDGPGALALRRAAMEEHELKEWGNREAEIRDLQEERLELLRVAIERREQEAEEALAGRVASLLETRTAEKAAALAQIQKKRVAAMRKLGAARTAHGVPSEPHTFLDAALEKSIKASHVHAPVPSARPPDYFPASRRAVPCFCPSSGCAGTERSLAHTFPHPLPPPQQASTARLRSTRPATRLTSWTSAPGTSIRTRSRLCSSRARSRGDRSTPPCGGRRTGRARLARPHAPLTLCFSFPSPWVTEAPARAVWLSAS